MHEDKPLPPGTIDTLSFDGKYNPTNPFLGSEPNWGAGCRWMLPLGGGENKDSSAGVGGCWLGRVPTVSQALGYPKYLVLHCGSASHSSLAPP